MVDCKVEWTEKGFLIHDYCKLQRDTTNGKNEKMKIIMIIIKKKDRMKRKFVCEIMQRPAPIISCAMNNDDRRCIPNYNTETFQRWNKMTMLKREIQNDVIAMCAETYTKFSNRFARLFHSNEDSKRNAKQFRLKERKREMIRKKTMRKKREKRAHDRLKYSSFFFNRSAIQ